MPAILDPAFLLRGGAILIIALALLVAGEVLIEKHFPKRAPLWAMVIVLPMLVTFLASLSFGAAAGAWIAYAILPQNFFAQLTAGLIGGFAGVWGIALLNQVLCNLLRARLGLQPRKVALWRN